MAFQLGFWADPIYKTGDYPDLVKSTMKSLNISLPAFTDTEIQRNKHSADFFAINHYTTSLVVPCTAGKGDCDLGFDEKVCSNWPSSGSDWLKGP